MVVTQLPIAPLLLLVWREQERQEQHLPSPGVFSMQFRPLPPQDPLSYLLLAVKLAARSTVASFLLMPVGGSRPWEPEGPGSARG